MKKYIIGTLIGFTLSLGVSAHAEVVNMIGKVIDGSFPIKINGVTLQNQALTIEGVSYLPTREFSEALGAKVKFDPDLGIEVEPTTTPAASAQPATPNPKYERYQQIDKELLEIGAAIRDLRETVNKIKTTNATKDQNVDDLLKQIAEKQAQEDKLVEEKHALEATDFK